MARSHSPERKKGYYKKTPLQDNICFYCGEGLPENKQLHLLICKTREKFKSFSTAELRFLHKAVKEMPPEGMKSNMSSSILREIRRREKDMGVDKESE